MLGGCSTHNACLLVWDDELADLEPYREKALATIAPEPHFYAEDELSPWFSAVAASARDRGLNVVTGPFNIRGGIRWNAAFAYVEPARSRPNLEIRANALAERVMLDGSRVVGAVVDGEEIRADVVVVSAGAVEKHISNVFMKLGLEPEDGAHRRVLAVLTYLRGA